MGKSATTIYDRSDLYSAYLEIIKDEALWKGDRESGLRSTVHNCATALNVERVGIWFFNDRRDQLDCRYLYDGRDYHYEPNIRILAQEHPAYFAAINAGRVVAANNALDHKATRSFSDIYLKPLGIGAILDVCLMEGGVITGIICIEHCRGPRIWTQEEQSFAIAIADIISQIEIISALAESREHYQKVFDASADAMILLDTHLVDCNDAAVRMFGGPREVLFQSQPSDFWPLLQPNGKPSSELAAQHFRSSSLNRASRFEWLHQRLDGSQFPSEVDLTKVLIKDKPHYLICVRDLTQRKAHENHIKKLLSMQQAIFDGASYCIISTDLEGTITSFNRAAENLLGYRSEELLAQRNAASFCDRSELEWRAAHLSAERHCTIEPGFNTLITCAAAGNTEERECTWLHKDGSRIPVLVSVNALRQDGDNITGYLFIASDISMRKRAAEALLQSQRDMEHRTNHDDLTGLPNRTRLHDQTQSAICTARQKQHKLALMLLDLDRFKEVNNTLGHSFGDDLIRHIGSRLAAYLSQHNAWIYRLGGDEFAVLVPEIHDLKAAEQLAEGVHKTLRELITLRGIPMEMSGSIGVAIYPEHGADSHSLLRCADVAMYKAKNSAAHTVYYQPQTDGHSPRRLTMMSELGHAIRSDQLTLHYQPRVDINTLSCVGCEALVRWQHPKLGMIPPFEFIPLAEVSDQIQALAYWVLKTALQQARRWLDAGMGKVVSVNLSTRNLMDVSIPEQIEHLLAQTGVPPKYLEIEITESTLIDDPERALMVIDRICKLGVSFAIDDFGTGYSSLAYLKRLPISTLKIDRSFIKDMLTDEQDAVIVRSTMSLAHSFGLAVVAEGVEDIGTLTALKALKCDQIQGFYFSKPLPVDEFERWVKRFNLRA